MPIQFQCPHCGHALQLPDNMAGKQGKCPKCSQAVTVQANSPGAPQDEEFWSELDGQKAAVQEEDHQEKKVRKSDAALLKGYLEREAAAKVLKRIGLPWERKDAGGLLERYWDTAIMAIQHPKETYGTMRLTGGVGQPFMFLLIGVVFGTLIASVYGAIANSVNAYALAQSAAEGEESRAMITGAVIVGIVVLFCISFFGGVILSAVFAFVQAGLLQLACAMTGIKGTNYESTFRVTAYCNGSIALCNIVPAIGWGFFLVLWFVGMIAGVASVYQVPQGKAAMAVILTFIFQLLLIVPIVVVIVMVVGGIMLAASGA